MQQQTLQHCLLLCMLAAPLCGSAPVLAPDLSGTTIYRSSRKHISLFSVTRSSKQLGRAAFAAQQPWWSVEAVLSCITARPQDLSQSIWHRNRTSLFSARSGVSALLTSQRQE